MKINEIERLYHGTDRCFDEFDFHKAKGFKDFGKGYYLTTNFNQALRWAQRKGSRNSKAYVYSYRVECADAENLKILELLKYDLKWLDFISQNRIYGKDTDYDIIFIDECSTIDNRTMMRLLSKLKEESLIVMAGDIYQIESIDFGNWFFYAKEIIQEKAIVELDNTWRTNEPTIKDLWEEVRFLRPIITEKLVINGPFSEDIGKNIFTNRDDDEVVLCLNYDGKFGLNSINSYFQDANPSQKAYSWSEWKYKIGDPILFNENKRFPMLYNNLKGVIVDIQNDLNSIKFIIDIPIILTAVKVRGTDLEIVSHNENTTRIAFSVYANDDNQADEEYEVARMKSIIPFQLAYAVSIHKAQGLEYNSVKIVIPQSNSERITHGVFYTAITRTKQKLKIYWSPETMTDIIAGFNEEQRSRISLDIIKGLISNN